MVRARATNAGGNRSGSRMRSKVTSHRSVKRARLNPTQFGRGICPVCRQQAPLAESGKMRSHRLYVVPCTGTGLNPLEEP